MILFTLMDHDVITCNDFGGESFLSLNTIPGVVASSSSVDNFHGLKPIELSLMFQKDPGKQGSGNMLKKFTINPNTGIS